MNAPEPTIQEEFVLDGWLVNSARREVSKASLVRRLEPKAMSLLLYLAARPGEVVSTATLLQTIWVDRVVEQGAVHRCVNQIRKCFDDDSSNPRVIKTITRQGYCLIAPVEIAASKAEPQIRRRLPWIWISTVLVGLVSLIWVLNRAVPTPNYLDPWLYVQLPAERTPAMNRLIQHLAEPSNFSLRLEQSVRFDEFVLGVNPQESNQSAIHSARWRIELTRNEDAKILWSDDFEPESDLEIEHAAILTRRYITAHRLAALEPYALGNTAREAWITGMVAFAAADVDTAEYHLRRAVKMEPRMISAWGQLSVMYAGRKMFTMPWVEAYPLAKQAIEKLISLAPDTPWIFSAGHFYLYFELDYERALAAYAASERFGIHPTIMLVQKGHIDSATGKLNSAIGHYRRALQLEPDLDLLLCYARIGRIQTWLGEYDDAVVTLSSASSLGGSSTVQLYLQTALAEAYWYAGDKVRATELTQKLWRDFGNTYPERNLVSLLALTGQRELAQQTLARMEQQFSEGELAYNTSAFEAAFYLGDYKLATLWLNRAIDNREVLWFGMFRHARHLEPIRQTLEYQQSMAHLTQLERRAREDVFEITSHPHPP